MGSTNELRWQWLEIISHKLQVRIFQLSNKEVKFLSFLFVFFFFLIAKLNYTEKFCLKTENEKLDNMISKIL